MAITKKHLLAFAVPLFLILCFPSVSLATYGKQTQTEHCTANLALPDPECTPGAVLTTDSKVVCVVGYTKTVRNVPLKEKKQVFAEYDIDYKLHSSYEVDHLISLELGGSNDISNLFPEAYKIQNGARTKDKFENYLHSQVCKGKMTLDEAQSEISSDWLKYYLVWQEDINKAKTDSKTEKPTQDKTSTQPTKNETTTPTTDKSTPTAQTTPPATDNKTPSTTTDATNSTPTTQTTTPAQESPPQGTTAKCKGGTYSFSTNRIGTCSRHGGVEKWL